MVRTSSQRLSYSVPRVAASDREWSGTLPMPGHELEVKTLDASGEPTTAMVRYGSLSSAAFPWPPPSDGVAEFLSSSVWRMKGHAFTSVGFVSDVRGHRMSDKSGIARLRHLLPGLCTVSVEFEDGSREIRKDVDVPRIRSLTVRAAGGRRR